MAARSSSPNGDADDDGPARPLPPNARPCTSKRIAHVELFRPKTLGGSGGHDAAGGEGAAPRGRRLPAVKRYHVAFAALYLCQAYWIASTSGVPYREFLDKAEREGFEGECANCVRSEERRAQHPLWSRLHRSGCVSCADSIEMLRRVRKCVVC